MIWLSDSDIERLTGYKQPSKQSTWLSQNGYKFTLAGNGKPLVDSEQFSVKSKVVKSKQPNFEAITHGQAA